MQNSACIFCKIVAGEIPATTIYEDTEVLCFLDIGPLNEGHCLIIPKLHCTTITDCPLDTVAQMARCMGRIAKAVSIATECDGYNILCNNGRAAGQLVDHVHFHVIPRFDGDKLFNKWDAKTYPEGKMAIVSEKIRANL